MADGAGAPQRLPSGFYVPVVAALFAAAVFVVDAFVAIDIAIAVLYVAVVIMSITFCGRRGVIAVSLACMGLTVLAFAVQHADEPISNSAARCAVSLLAIIVTTFLALWIQSSTRAIRNQARLLDLTHDAIFVRDMNDVITYWNRGAENLYGWPAAEALGRVSHDLVQSEFPTARNKIVGELLNTGFWEGDIVHTKRDGSKVTVSSRWSLQRDPRGEPIATLETNTDIDDRRQAQEKLARAQAELAQLSRVSAMGELTASIAHEVNQPLAAIVTRGEASLRWLGVEPPSFDRVRRGLERMIADAQRASGVVRRLRALASKDGLKTAPTSLNEVIEEAMPLIRRELNSHRVSLSLDLAKDLPQVQGDRLLLQLVVVNLALNAVQAMSAVEGRRELSIRTRTDGDEQVRVSVADTGPGFGPEAEANLFNAFFTTKPTGMGMGLTISRSIVETHGGKIAASRNEAGGATFEFSVPLKADLQP